MKRAVLALSGVIVVAILCVVVVRAQALPRDFLGPVTRFWFLHRSTFIGPSEAGVAFRELRWYELGPKNWDPYKQLWKLQRDMPKMSDTDPRAIAMLKQVQEIWANASTNGELDHASIRIVGYIVPLEQSKIGIKEFLLVQYFGACIHTPPPPSNQMIHVMSRETVWGMRAMDTAWVSANVRRSTGLPNIKSVGCRF